MAEKYYSVSPYAFCSNNPVNFVDWDGRMPFLLPVAPYVVSAVVSAVAAVSVVYAAYEGYNTLRDQSGWKNQQRRDRKAKEELDRAQLNVQNSIKENFPDPDNYDPNDRPEFRRGTKFSAAAFLGLYLLGDDSSFLRQFIILLLEAKEEKKEIVNESENSSEGDNSSNESALSDSKDDNDVNIENLWTDENMELWQ